MTGAERVRVWLVVLKCKTALLKHILSISFRNTSKLLRRHSITPGLINGKHDGMHYNAEGTLCLQALLSSFVKLACLISKTFSSDNIL